MRYDALTFDLDGTLVDTAGEIAEAVNGTLRDFGLGTRSEVEITHLIGHGLRDLMVRLLARITQEQPAWADRLPVDAMLARVALRYAALAGTRALPYPGAREALVALRVAGVRTACVTNKDAVFAARLLAATGLQDQLDLVIAGDTLAHKKPHPAVLQHAAAQLQVPLERLAHVGDSRTDIEAACNAGVTAWAVPYGYNGGEPVALSRPHRLFADLAEVAAHALALRHSG